MKGVIYARYSSDNQREESIEGQIRECMEFADRQGITVVANYIDRAFSAKTDDRPDFQRMIKDSAKHLFDVVIVWKLDRFARNRYDSARNKAILKKNGVRVVSAKENISDRPEGILLEAMLEGYAEFYSAELSEKVIRGMTENALKCKSNGSLIPYGYYVGEDRKFHIEPTEAKVVQEVYQRYAEGEPSTKICTDLNARGIRSKTGKDFSPSVIVFMLHNRKYIGEYRFMDIVVENGVPQIVSPELYDRVQERFARNRKAPARFKTDVDYMLTTKLYCGKCGAFMAGESGTSRTGEKYHYYKCSKAKRGKGCKKKAIRKEIIEYAVVKYTVDHALSDTAINRVADMMVKAQEEEDRLLPLLKKRLEENRNASANLLDAVQKGFFNETVKARMDELEAEKEELEMQIIQEEMQQPNLNRDMIVHWMERFRYGDIREATFQKQIIDYFVKAVYVYDDRIVLIYTFKDDSKTITLEEVNRIFHEELTGSDLTSCGEPIKKAVHLDGFFDSLLADEPTTRGQQPTAVNWCGAEHCQWQNQRGGARAKQGENRPVCGFRLCFAPADWSGAPAVRDAATRSTGKTRRKPPSVRFSTMFCTRQGCRFEPYLGAGHCRNPDKELLTYPAGGGILEAQYSTCGI